MAKKDEKERGREKRKGGEEENEKRGEGWENIGARDHVIL